MNVLKHCVLVSFALSLAPSIGFGDELGEHGFVDSSGVKLHYVTKGKGPLLVMIHGFPDFWYTWRKQIPALSEHFQVVAYDQRGFNKSDKPEGVDNYKMEKLVGDLMAVVDHFKSDKPVIVGHDWGGMVAWSYAMKHSDRIDRLVILNLPHPAGLMRELENNPDQRRASQYARTFQTDEAGKNLTADALTFWVRGEATKKRYREALGRSSIEGMLNYYKANYPRAPFKAGENKYPKVKCSVLMFHGLKDTALLPGALNDTWQWVSKDLTLITLPEAGHFVQRDASDTVTKRMVRWLTQ